MRIIFTIPHFHDQKESGRYGSERTPAYLRANALERCVSSLHQTFGSRQGLFTQPATSPPRASNERTAATIDVVLCTTGQQHLAGCLSSRLIHHHKTNAEPKALGFACHSILRSALGRYDYYCFLEDDLEITDGLFFKKLAWFSAQFSDRALLQPNRFEVSNEGAFQKLYVDGNTSDLSTQAKFQDVTLQPKLVASCFDENWLFQRVRNPHSGCFFLNQTQMAVLAKQPDFGTFSSDFLGPLESAATLSVMRHLDIYKPSRENASFLEIRHLDQRYLDMLFRYHEENGKIIATVGNRDT
jgi:hypothetical protein